MAGAAAQPRDRGHDGVEIADLGLRLDAAVEQGADDDFVDEIVADLELARAASCAMRAEVPVPQGERSIALSP